MTLNVSSIRKILLTLYKPTGSERIGFVTKANEIVEVPNVSPNPDEGFMVAPKDIILYSEINPSYATWHTHPGASSNLSNEDFVTFKLWKDYVHFIIGNDGVRAYKYDEKRKTIMELDDE